MSDISFSNATSALINRARIDEVDYTKAAPKAAQTDLNRLSGKKILRDISDITYVAKDNTRGSPARADRPALAAPATPVSEDPQSAEAKFVKLMATIIGLLGDASLKGLESRLASLRAMSSAINGANAALSKEYQEALAELEAAIGSATTTQEQLEAAKARVNNAQTNLDKAEAVLAGLDPQSPEYAEAKVAVDAARAELQSANKGLVSATTAHQTAMDAAKAASVKADEISQRLYSEGVKGGSALKDMQKAHTSAAAQMVELMSRFVALMGEAADERMESDQAMAAQIRDAQQAKAVKEAEKQAEEVRKAEAANKAMGCVGKVLGGLLTVVSVVGAVFTGGATLALAAVGLALMAGDMIYKAATGNSFMEKALSPLMDKVLGPMTKWLGKALGDLLHSEMIGNILGAIASAAIMIATIALLTVVTKGAASRMSPKIAELVGKQLTKAVPDLLKHGAKSFSRGAGQMMNKIRSGVGMKTDAVSMQRYATTIEQGMVVTEAGSTGAQMGLQAKSGVHQARAAENMAAVFMTQVVLESVSEFIERAVEIMGDALNKQFEQIENMMAALKESLATSEVAARHIKI